MPRPRVRALVFAPVLALLGSSSAGAVGHNDAWSYSALRNEAGFHPDALSRYSLQRPDEAVLSHLAQHFAIESRAGDTFQILVPPAQAEIVHTLAPSAHLLDQNINPWITDPSYDSRQGYRDYEAVRSTLEEWQQSYPRLVQLQEFPYMVSNDGREILVAKISKEVEQEHPDRPSVVITAATHGDEHLTSESLLVNVEKLLKGYQSNPRFQRIIDQASLYIIPIVSPDSFLRSRNVHGTDPNRVYDYPGKTQGGKHLKSAQGMIRFYKELVPDAVLDFHGAPPRGMIMYPWGYARKEIEDTKIRERHDNIAQKMGKSTPGYAVGPIFSTIYVAPGSTVDHNYYRHDMLAMVIEIGGGRKSPPISSIPKLAEEVEEATWIFVESLIDQEGGSGSGGSSGSGNSTTSENTSASGSSQSASSGDDTSGDSRESNSGSDSSQGPALPSEPSPTMPAIDEANKQASGSCQTDLGSKGGAWALFLVGLLAFTRRKP